jgi:hypothetical protein
MGMKTTRRDGRWLEFEIPSITMHEVVVIS